jgi:hypothetical protein
MGSPMWARNWAMGSGSFTREVCRPKPSRPVLRATSGPVEVLGIQTVIVSDAGY